MFLHLITPRESRQDQMHVRATVPNLHVGVDLITETRKVNKKRRLTSAVN